MHRFAIAAASPRAHSEDVARVLEVPGGWIVIVADGAGGVSGGATASELAVAGIERAVADGLDLAGTADWVDLLESLDQEIAGAVHAGESTCVALAVTSAGLVGASCGDSRAWLWNGAGAHELTERQDRKRLGTRRARAQAFHAAAEGTLLVATDGLHDYAPFDAVTGLVLGAGDAAPEAMVQLVRERNRSLPDDVAIVVGWLGAGG